MIVNVTRHRIENLIEELYKGRYSSPIDLDVTITTDKEPIPYDQLESRTFNKIHKGMKWGELWDSAWFRFRGRIPESWKGREVAALLDIGGEGCVFKEGKPYQGITYKRTEAEFERKRRVMISDKAEGDDDVDLLVEGAANGLFGDKPSWNTPWPFFTLNQAELVLFNREIWQLAMDMEFLLQLYGTLDPRQPRAKRILAGLNRVANLTPVNKRVPEALALTKELLEIPNSSSQLTAWSVGHAHMDLAWLWRYKETRRKGGRTFSTAMRMMEEYPDYIFGASQPQLFAWVKEDYPSLYEEVKEAVKSGRMECQGGMWVEPDMNLTGGEALVRQCLYGKRFFKEEFGKDINNLWLPDVFGYSGALPQILKKSGIDFFITQKMTWNETNEFPHHTFMWEGIDGTAVQSHFLPANMYNGKNEPPLMVEAGLRYTQSDIRDGFLNLYGIGDGGGGPSRRHIEWAERGQNCEGMPKIKHARAEEFFSYLQDQNEADLPRWRGELYLEKHRGTLTSQAQIKKENRLMEQKLRDVEFLVSLSKEKEQENDPVSEIERIWKETLLNQFHDVLPGSSIKEVYDDVKEINEKNFSSLKKIEESSLSKIFSIKKEDCLTFVNTQPWERTEIVTVEERDYSLTLPSLGFLTLSLEDLKTLVPEEEKVNISEDGTRFENEQLSILLGEEGTITSLILKDSGQEMLSPGGAGLFSLYEDKPYCFNAWEVSSYYRETVPETARLVTRKILKKGPLAVQVEQLFTIGNSEIRQILELRSGESMLRSQCFVNWQESEKMLRVSAFTAITWPTATYEIQYGSLQRPTHDNTGWDEAQFEVCGHRYADLSQPDRGLALINDGKYGYRIKEGVMELNLLKSPVYPDPTADRGQQEFSFAYMAHRGMVQDSRVLQVSHDFNSPLILVKGSRTEDNQCSWFSLDTEQICLDVVKPAEDGNGMILRLYETQGGSCCCQLKSLFPFVNIFETNLLEEERTPVYVKDPQLLDLEFTPFEIKTLLLKGDR